MPLETSYTSQAAGSAASGGGVESDKGDQYWSLGKLRRCYSDYLFSKRQELDEQIERTKNPDRRARLQFVAPALSADAAERDRFAALIDAQQDGVLVVSADGVHEIDMAAVMRRHRDQLAPLLQQQIHPRQSRGQPVLLPADRRLGPVAGEKMPSLLHGLGGTPHRV